MKATEALDRIVLIARYGGDAADRTADNEAEAFIIRAVENFDPLVKALESALDRLERVDKIALKALNQNPSPEPYELGEVTRGRALLAEVKKGEH